MVDAADNSVVDPSLGLSLRGRACPELVDGKHLSPLAFIICVRLVFKAVHVLGFGTLRISIYKAGQVPSMLL